MTKANRTESISETFKWEGGYSNDASDTGGPTKYGITIADVRKYINPNATAQDVKNLTQQQANDIYVNKYWKTPYYDCDTLAPGVDFSVFDFGVNSGPSRAKSYLDKAIGGSDVDTISKLNDARLAFVTRIVENKPSQAVFLNGWTRRIKGVKAKALEMNKRPKPPTVGAKEGAGVAGIGALITAFITGHKALIIVAGAFILIAGTLAYLENKKKSNVKKA